MLFISLSLDEHCIENARNPESRLYDIWYMYSKALEGSDVLIIAYKLKSPDIFSVSTLFIPFFLFECLLTCPLIKIVTPIRYPVASIVFQRVLC